MTRGMTLREPTTPREWLQNVWDGLYSTLVGLKITGRYMLQKPITIQYPDERMPIPDRYRGIHYLEQEKCINCLACARACPIDCIEMDAIRHGKELEWVAFSVDYQKCMFCELCVYPCPKDCIHMGTEYAFVTDDRSELKHDLLSFKGMSRDAKVRMKEAEIKKAAKEAAKKAKAAAKAAEAEKAEKEGGEQKAEKATKADKPDKADKPAKSAKAKKKAPKPKQDEADKGKAKPADSDDASGDGQEGSSDA